MAVPNVLFCLCVIGYACRSLGESGWRYVLTWVRPSVGMMRTAFMYS